MNLLLALLAFVACGPRRAPAPELGAPTSTGPAPAPLMAGFVADGVFTDSRWGLTLPIPDGWEAQPGLDQGALRVAVVDPVRGTRVELWVFRSLGTAPRPRSDCRWTFVDTGRYRAAGLPGPLTTATCTPDDPTAPRVYAWLLPAEHYGVQAELHVPVTALVDGRHDAEAILRGLRF
ncbi:MAG: hypothetical protein D6798_12640 [Deltaproteobacteria bacterium]|nr:MAG: hypothetical protein D6798_12640 [Deltaproteobacteria bacterium]